MRAIVFALLAAGCGSGVQGRLPSPDTSPMNPMNPMKPMKAAPATLHDQGDNPNPALFEKDAHPYGADMVTWGERASQWIWGTPAAHNPLLGADCGVGRSRTALLAWRKGVDELPEFVMLETEIRGPFRQL